MRSTSFHLKEQRIAFSNVYIMSMDANSLECNSRIIGPFQWQLGIAQAEEIQLSGGASVRDLLTLLAKRHGAPFTEAVY